jgi:CheY-like chemotaxis protein
VEAPAAAPTNGAVATASPPTNGAVLDAARIAVEGEEFYSGSAADATVLVVDDDFRNVFAMTALLERGSLNVVSASGGMEALETLAANSEIDLVLMDIMMPGMDGYETMRKIRKRPEFADLPIIAVTGKVVGGERERCLEAGASDYIPKPVNTAELLSALREWFPPDAWRP